MKIESLEKAQELVAKIEVEEDGIKSLESIRKYFKTPHRFIFDALHKMIGYHYGMQSREIILTNQDVESLIERKEMRLVELRKELEGLE